MGSHEKAWDGLTICVFGAAPMIPMQIEQTISGTAPGSEHQIESFEDYNQAYDFCRQTRNVGFMVLLEECGGLPVDQVFRELAKHYEARGLPCFGVILHAGNETKIGLRALSANNRFIDYLPHSLFLDSNTCSDAFQNIWNRFVNKFESTVIPDVLQTMLSDIAAGEIGKDSVVFYDRITLMLSSNLNLSWMEMVALRWQLVLQTVIKHHAFVLNTQRGLQSLATIATPDPSFTSNQLIELVRSKIPLPVRVATLGILLNQLRQDGCLSKELDNLVDQMKPGAPALWRHLVKNRDAIVQMISETNAIQKVG